MSTGGIVALGLGGITLGLAWVALIWWLTGWVRSEIKEGKAVGDELDASSKRVDELAAAVEDRDHAIGRLEDDLGTSRELLALARTHRDESLAIVEEMGRKNPASLGPAIRAELERLRSLSQDVPELPTTAAGEGGRGDASP